MLLQQRSEARRNRLPACAALFRGACLNKREFIVIRLPGHRASYLALIRGASSARTPTATQINLRRHRAVPTPYCGAPTSQSVGHRPVVWSNKTDGDGRFRCVGRTRQTDSEIMYLADCRYFIFTFDGSREMMAEREGFEPPIPLRVCLISSQVHSTGLCHLSTRST